MLPIPVSKTKIIPPRRRDELLARKRLLDILFDALDKKLILVSAPAGYGKTSLLIDLSRYSEYKCCWLSLDELDREPQRFITYLLASIEQQFPDFGHQTMAVLNGLPSLENEVERLAVMLVNEAYSMIHEHFVLILDDFHILESEKPIHDFLNRFIQLADDNFHIVIASRTLTTLYDLPLMVAREQVSGLSFSDLAFRAEEIQALILQNNKIHITDEDAGKLIEETEGWITGLQFSGSNFLQKDIHKPALNTGVGLFDYLGQQVLDRQKPVIREFLLRTSLMEEFDANLCETVLSPFYKRKQDWDAFIKAIVQNNLFALPVGVDGRSLRYHHLFRDYLRTRLRKERESEVKPILARLGSAYESMGEWEKAHYVIKQLGDSDALAGIVERASYNNLHRTLPIVENWLGDLPPSILKKHPGILSVSGAIKLIKGDFQGGQNLLDRAIKDFREQGNISHLALSLIRRSAGHRYLGNYSKSIRDIDEAIQLIEDHDDWQSLFAEALHVKGLAFLRVGQIRQALDFFEQSYDVLMHLNDTANIPDLLLEIGAAHQILGNYREAESTYSKVLQIWRRDANIWAQASLLNNIGNLHHQEGEYEKSALAYEEGLLCARRSGNVRSEALLSIGLGDLYAELCDFEIAHQSYDHAADLLRNRQDQFLLFSLLIGRVNLALLQGGINGVRGIMTEIKNMVKPDQSHYENGMFDFVRGKLLLFEGKHNDAIRALESAEAHLRNNGRELESITAQIWLAAAYCVNKKWEAAARMIPVPVGERKKNAHVAIVAVVQSQKWLKDFQQYSVGDQIVRNLFLQAERLAASFPSVRRELHRHARVVQMPAPRLLIQAFGSATVKIGGQALTISDWQTQSVRDLFFFFLTQTKPLTKEQIAEILWPEIDDPAKIKLRFKNELYRLRRAVGQETILFENVVYSFNRNLDYEYDVEAFESFLAGARSAKKMEDQIDLYQKAVDLVRGPYLNDISFEWAAVDRQRLNQKYQDALLALADLYQKQARFDEALAVCQLAIKKDPTLEGAYRLSMEIYQRLGDRQAILRTYQACSEALKQSLFIRPSKATEDLYRKLLE